VTWLFALLLATPIRHEVLQADDFSAHVFRLDLAAVKLELRAAQGVPRQTVAELVARDPVVVAANASYFDTEDRAMGVVRGQGRAIPAWSALVLEKGEARLVVGRALDAQSRRAALLQGTPRLLVDGVIQKLKPQRARRTAVCAEGKTLILVVTTRADATALARFLKERIGCRNALALDGGASTQLEVRWGDLRISEAGQAVPNALVVVPSAPAP
jgi:exopolysaccharide biosynthesis protein